MRLNEIDGSYYPSFFCIVLDCNCSALEAMNKYRSTFSHEFIHFLQDLILPYNIRMNLSYMNWFKNIRSVAVDKGRIKRPFDEWYYDSITTRTQFKYTFKSSIPIEKVWEMGYAKSTCKRLSGFDASYTGRYREFDVYRYDLPINKHKTYHLDASDMLEYIAYKIEAKQYGEKNLPQLPYHSIDLLFEKYGLSYVSEDIRICISEFCLYNDNPVHMLFLDFLDNENFKNIIKGLSYKDVYQQLINHKFETKDGVIESVSSKKIRRLKQFAEYLSTTYKCFPDIASWVLKANDFASTNFSQRFIFSDLYNMDKTNFESIVRLITSEVGIPLLLNKKEKYESLNVTNPTSHQFEQFYILQKFITHALSKSKNTSCPILNFCTENYQLKNKNCQRKGKLKISDTEGCPYNVFLQSYGLLNIDEN